MARIVTAQREAGEAAGLGESSGMSASANTVQPRTATKVGIVWATVGLLALTAGFAVPEVVRHQWAEPEPVTTEAAPQETTAYTPPAPPEIPDVRMLLLRLGVGTALVLCLCAGTIWVGKRWLTTGAKAAPGMAQLQLVESLNLGNRCLVYLVRAGNQQALVGVDRIGMKALVPLSDSFESTLQDVAAGDDTPADRRGQVVPFANPRA
jgi:flagellar biogenesis protein FliO